MSRYKETSELVDGILNILVLGSAVAAGMAAPNIFKALEKPLDNYAKHMDRRAKEREKLRLVRYMKQQGLIKGEYEHGLTITKKGRERLKQAKLNLRIEPQIPWDKKWRLVLYDIPEKYKNSRDALTAKLRDAGFYQLQRSVWIHPYPCRHHIEVITFHYCINKYVTYLEVTHIDNSAKLVEKFKAKNIM